MRVKIDRVNERKNNLIKDYSSMNFNWQSVMRVKNFKDFLIDDIYHRTHIRPYNSKMSFSYVDRVMDRLAKRRSIDYVIAFVEQDDYLNNHLHFAWSCPVELTREQLAKSMRTSLKYIRDIKPIQNETEALNYFTKRLYGKGSYNNIYSY